MFIPDLYFFHPGSRIQRPKKHLIPDSDPQHCTPQGTSTIIPNLYIDPGPKHLFFHSYAKYYWFFESFSTVSSIILSSPLINSFFCVTYLRPYPCTVITNLEGLREHIPTAAGNYRELRMHHNKPAPSVLTEVINITHFFVLF
jgi:hypothetical protein